MGKGTRKKNSGAESGKLHRLTVQLEFGDTRPENYSAADFQSLVDVAIRKVLGVAAPEYQLDTFDPRTLKGSLVTDGSNLHLLWAALSIYGMHFEQRIAFHLNSLHSE